jgi:hypothetical protein
MGRADFASDSAAVRRAFRQHVSGSSGAWSNFRRHVSGSSGAWSNFHGGAVLVGIVSGLLVTAAVLCSAPGANARSTFESPYGYARTWNAALRLVRVDNGWRVTEKDDANGYLLFDYKSPENGKTTPGSLELVRGSRPESSVSVLVQLAQMPHYHEQVILDALASKMRREYGDAPAPGSPVEPIDGGDGRAD